MQTRIAAQYADMPRIDEADAILRSCVHCGFCNATCPTYLELGDERDGPRGRIYLISQLLEGHDVTTRTQTHLDRCLSCRNCETTCPSGVEYGRLLDIGRDLIERQVRRPAGQRLARWLLKFIVPHRRRFGTLLVVGRMLRPVLPATLRAKVPPRRRRPSASPNSVGTTAKSASISSIGPSDTRGTHDARARRLRPGPPRPRQRTKQPRACSGGSGSGSSAFRKRAAAGRSPTISAITRPRFATPDATSTPGGPESSAASKPLRSRHRAARR